MPSRPRRAGLLAAGLVLSVAGCSGADSPEPAKSSGTGPAGATQATVSGPEAALREASALEPEVRGLITRLSDACLRARGVTEIPPRGTSAAHGVPGVVLSPAKTEAAERGYGIGATGGDSDQQESDFTFTSPEAEERYQRALGGGGDEIGGCTKEARIKVFGAVASPRSPVAEIGEAATRAYTADAEVTAGLKGWRSCLAEAGYQGLTDPEDALRYAQYFYYPVGARPGGAVPKGGPWPRKTAREKEIALARADAGCADSSGLRAVQERVWTKALGDAVAGESAQLFGYVDAMKTALERGRRELKG